MTNSALSNLASAYAECHGISYFEAMDIIKETISVCTETQNNETEYCDIASVIRDYLDLGDSWSKLFK